MVIWLGVSTVLSKIECGTKISDPLLSSSKILCYNWKHPLPLPQSRENISLHDLELTSNLPEKKEKKKKMERKKEENCKFKKKIFTMSKLGLFQLYYKIYQENIDTCAGFLKEYHKAACNITCFCKIK